ncbi:hypothetical protein EG328_012071 [Venturia inaequalis]|nr:hypothetical protein EG328_012071 [Venturia inaequalis]KAE9992447.1 hypothetical protein EG327_008963 [Venturia inaequalis]RDI85139.1 hypothetical protein Vi05172_g5143 [Venturia inaequalis]
MATITRNFTIIAANAIESNATRTGFLSLPRELRQSILRQTVQLNELEKATQQITDRFLTWDDLFTDHEAHILTWSVTLKLVHREIHADVEYVKEKWEEDFHFMHEQKLVAYEEVARKRRAQFLDAQPRFQLPYPSFVQTNSASPKPKKVKIRIPRKTAGRFL